MSLLNKGGFGKILDNLDGTVNKVVYDHKRGKGHALREAMFYFTHQHKRLADNLNIMRGIPSRIDITLSRLHITMKRYDNNLVGLRLSMEDLNLMFSSLLEAVEYLHETLHFAHCEIRPHNVMWDCKYGSVLIDFGRASPIWSRARLDENSGPFFPVSMSYPEDVEEKSSYSLQDIDIWGVGIVLHHCYECKQLPTIHTRNKRYQTCFNRTQYEHHARKSLFGKGYKTADDWFRSGVPPGYWDVMATCLGRAPRPSIADLKQIVTKANPAMIAPVVPRAKRESLDSAFPPPSKTEETSRNKLWGSLVGSLSKNKRISDELKSDWVGSGEGFVGYDFALAVSMALEHIWESIKNGTYLCGDEHLWIEICCLLYDVITDTDYLWITDCEPVDVRTRAGQFVEKKKHLLWKRSRLSDKGEKGIKEYSFREIAEMHL